MFGIVGVAAITVICYLIGLSVKVLPLDDKYIPMIVGICGAILGVIGYVSGMPDFPAQDMIRLKSK